MSEQTNWAVGHTFPQVAYQPNNTSENQPREVTRHLINRTSLAFSAFLRHLWTYPVELSPKEASEHPNTCRIYLSR